MSECHDVWGEDDLELIPYGCTCLSLSPDQDWDVLLEALKLSPQVNTLSVYEELNEEVLPALHSITSIEFKRCGPGVVRSWLALPGLVSVRIWGGADKGDNTENILKVLIDSNVKRVILEDSPGLSDDKSSVLTRFSGLTHLYLEKCPGLSSDVVDVVAKIPDLRSFELFIDLGRDVNEFPMWVDKMGELSHVEELVLHHCFNWSHSALEPLGKLTQLEYLTLHDVSGLDSLGFLEGMKHLSTLYLSGLTVNTDMIDVISLLSRLERLSLVDCQARQGDEYAGLDVLKNLRELVLDRSNINDGALRRLLKALPGLEVLSLNDCYRIDGEGFDALGDLTSLRSLRLENTNISGYLGCLENLPGLSYLDIEHCELDDEDLAAIDKLVQLDEIDFSPFDGGTSFLACKEFFETDRAMHSHYRCEYLEEVEDGRIDFELRLTNLKEPDAYTCREAYIGDEVSFVLSEEAYQGYVDMIGELVAVWRLGREDVTKGKLVEVKRSGDAATLHIESGDKKGCVEIEACVITECRAFAAKKATTREDEGKR